MNPSPPDEIVELRAPNGNSVTHKMYRNTPGPMDLQWFLSQGYTIVTPKDSAA